MGWAMLVAQRMNFTEYIVELINIYGSSFMHIVIITINTLTFKRSLACFISPQVFKLNKTCNSVTTYCGPPFVFVFEDIDISQSHPSSFNVMLNT